jgi:hypothetical protein
MVQCVTFLGLDEALQVPTEQSKACLSKGVAFSGLDEALQVPHRTIQSCPSKVTLFLSLVFEVPIPVASGAELDNTPMATKASMASPMPSKEPSLQQ